MLVWLTLVPLRGGFEGANFVLAVNFIIPGMFKFVVYAARKHCNVANGIRTPTKCLILCLFVLFVCFLCRWLQIPQQLADTTYRESEFSVKFSLEIQMIKKSAFCCILSSCRS